MQVRGWQNWLRFSRAVLAKQKWPSAVGSLQVSGAGIWLCCTEELGFIVHTSCWKSWDCFQAQLDKCTLCSCPWWPVAQPSHVRGVEGKLYSALSKGCWQWEGTLGMGRGVGWSTLLKTKISIEKEGNYKAKAVGVIGACVVLSWKTFKAFLSSWREVFFWL